MNYIKEFKEFNRSVWPSSHHEIVDIIELVTEVLEQEDLESKIYIVPGKEENEINFIVQIDRIKMKDHPLVAMLNESLQYSSKSSSGRYTINTETKGTFTQGCIEFIYKNSTTLRRIFALTEYKLNSINFEYYLTNMAGGQTTQTGGITNLMFSR